MSAAEFLDPQRIWDRCEALAQLSELRGGLTRVFLSKEQAAANALVLGWMREAGMSARTDAIGNVLGRYEAEQPGAPCLMLGSHLDTVRDAGKYDGMLGVVAAIECVAALHRAGVRLPFALEVVGFSDEEGTRFGATLLGSRAIAGTFESSVLQKRDRAGVTMADAMNQVGLDPELVGTARRDPSDLLAYAELHIEQGPVLEAEGLAVGVVTAINGATRYMIELHGLAGHSGTVPMNLRQDALTTAAECILGIEARARETPELVATVGQIEAFPGAVNVIPGRVRFSVDVRSPRDAERITAAEDVLALIRRVAAARKVRVDIVPTHTGATATCAPWLMAQLERAIRDEGLPVRRLPSGAGHDGMAMIDIADICMLFVRCEKGISHNPAEAITLADAATSARVFLRFIEGFSPGK